MSTPFKLRPDGRLHIATYGEHKNGKDIQIFNRAVADDLVADWKKRGAQELLLDFDHESLDPTKRTTAAGWVGDLHADDEGLWGRTRWTDTGRTAAESGEYRYTSPVWDAAPLGGNRFKPVRLTDIGLTNKPCLSGLKAISNRNPSTPTKETTMNLTKIAVALGLAETATEDEILAAIKSLDEKSKDYETEVVANRRKEGEAFADKFGVTDADKRKQLVNRFVSDRAEVESLYGLLPEQKKPADQATPPRSIANREPGKTPADEQADKDKAEAQSAVRIANRAKQLEKSEGISYGRAFKQAQAEEKAGSLK